MNIAVWSRCPKWMKLAWLLGYTISWPLQLFRGGSWLLVVHLGSLGDGLLFTGALRAVRRGSPGKKIMLVVTDRAYSLFRRCKDVDRIVPFGANNTAGWWASLIVLAQTLRVFSRRFEVVLCPGVAFGSDGDFLTRLAASSRRLIMDYGTFETFDGLELDSGERVTGAMPSRVHELDRILYFLQTAGFEVARSRQDIWPETYLTEEDRTLAETEIGEIRRRAPDSWIISVCAGARFTQKDWGAANYIDLVIRMATHRPVVAILLGADVDRSVAETIEAGLGTHPRVVVRNHAGSTDLYSAMAIIEQSDACVGNDTFGLHAAIAVDTPSVVVMWGGDYDRWAPWGNPARHRMVRSRDQSCFGCHGECTREDYSCMTSISVEEVLQEVLALPAR